MNTQTLLTPVVITALEVKCEDLEFERDVYLDFVVRNLTEQAVIQIKIREQK